MDSCNRRIITITERCGATSLAVVSRRVNIFFFFAVVVSLLCKSHIYYRFCHFAISLDRISLCTGIIHNKSPPLYSYYSRSHRPTIVEFSCVLIGTSKFRQALSTIYKTKTNADKLKLKFLVIQIFFTSVAFSQC